MLRCLLAGPARRWSPLRSRAETRQAGRCVRSRPRWSGVAGGQQLIKGRGVRLAAALAVFAAAAPLHAAAVQGAASAASHTFTGAAAFTGAQPLAESLQKAAAGQSLACHAQQAHAEFRPEHVCRSFAPPLYGIMPPAPVCVVGPEISVMSGLSCHVQSRVRHADGQEDTAPLSALLSRASASPHPAAARACVRREGPLLPCGAGNAAVRDRPP